MNKPADGALNRGFWLVFLATLIVYLVNTNASPLGDSAAAFPLATSIVTEQNLTLNEYVAVSDFADGGWVERNADDDLVAYFPWATGLAALPVVVVVDAVSLVGVGDGTEAMIKPMGGGYARLQSIAGSLWTALAVMGIYVFARRDNPGRSAWFAAAVALVFAFGTSAWSTAAFQLWQHGPSLACMTWSLVLLQRIGATPPAESGGRGLAASGAFLGVLVGLGAIFRPTNFVVAVAVFVLVSIRHRRLLVPFVLGGSAIAAPWLIATRLTYGSWLQPYGGSDRLQFHDEYLQALAANLFSTGRGLVVFSPIVAVAAVGAARTVRSHKEAAPLEVLSVVVIIVHWLVISALPHWTGGHSFGPRLFTDVLPFMVVLAIPVVGALSLPRRGARAATAAFVLVVALSALSIGVHAQSTLVISTRCWNRLPVDIDEQYSRVWSLDDPMVTAGYRDLIRDPSAAVRGICTR